jgi:hypothetical protein
LDHPPRSTSGEGFSTKGEREREREEMGRRWELSATEKQATA